MAATRGMTAVRGMTLMELMIVVAIIGMVASGTALYSMDRYREAQVTTAKTAIRVVRAAALHHQMNESTCPTVEGLVEERLLDRGGTQRDPWGGRFSITCPRGDVMVASAGPDRREWTEDDLLVPDMSAFVDPFDEGAGDLPEDLQKGIALDDWIADAKETQGEPALAAKPASVTQPPGDAVGSEQ